MDLVNLPEEILAVVGRKSWVWQGCFIIDMVPVQDIMVKALDELTVPSSFKERLNEASLSFQLNIVDAQTTLAGRTVHDHLFRFQQHVSIEPTFHQACDFVFIHYSYIYRVGSKPYLRQAVLVEGPAIHVQHHELACFPLPDGVSIQVCNISPFAFLVWVHVDLSSTPSISRWSLMVI